MRTTTLRAGTLLALLLIGGCGGSEQGGKSAEMARLAAELGSEDPKTWGSAQETLLGQGRAALPALVGVLESGAPRAMSRAGSVMTRIDVGPVSDRLRVLVDGAGLESRFWASLALWKWGYERDDRVRPILLGGILSGGPGMREIGIRELLTARSLILRADAIPALEKALYDPLHFVPPLAAKGLAKIGREAVPALVRALADPEADWWAIGALRDLGSEAAEAVPALEAIAAQVTTDSAKQQRKEKAAEALRKIRGP